MKKIDLNSLKILNLMERKGLTLVHDELLLGYSKGAFVVEEYSDPFLYGDPFLYDDFFTLLISEVLSCFQPITKDQMYYLLGKISESEKEMILKQYNDKKESVKKTQEEDIKNVRNRDKHERNLQLLKTLLFHEYSQPLFVGSCGNPSPVKCYVEYDGNNLIKTADTKELIITGLDGVIDIIEAYVLVCSYCLGEEEVAWYLNNKFKEDNDSVYCYLNTELKKCNERQLEQVGQKYESDLQLSLHDKAETNLLIQKNKVYKIIKKSR